MPQASPTSWFRWPSLRAWACALSCALSSALWAPLPVSAADAGATARSRAPFPQIELPTAAAVQGQRAVDLLGHRLPEVAAWYGKSAQEFSALLRQDRRLRIDRRGRLFVEETLDAPLAAAPAAASSTALTGALAPLDQTFSLHSRPGAQRTIYLNFLGAQINGTAWNGSGGTITALPFDTDGLPYSTSAAELERIQYIWQRVAEDYSPFDVDVTTEAPPSGAITRAGASDAEFGTVVVVTSRSGVYSCNCGGVAYIGAFDDTSDYYKPALVFYDALGGGNEKFVAEAVSHEAGHNVGLLHDGYSGGGYYPGHGSGATGWAPIMGVGYYQPLVQWSKGEYASANNAQDDYAVMGGYGLPLRPDDHGGSAGTATPLSLADDGSLAADGVIERPGDLDWFSFTSGAGAATFSVVPAARSPNVDLRLELRSAAGSLLASANPADALPASLSTTLAAGSYYLVVTGTGKGDPLTTGYTAYGSTGQYALSATVPAGAGQPPTAVVSATPVRGTVPLTVSLSGAGSSDPDGSIVGYAWAFGDGTGSSGASVSHTYTSAGSFTAELRVTDDSGLTASRSVVITVDPALAVTPMHVADIAMSATVSRKGRAQAQAVVLVQDDRGTAVPGAAVSGRWSGVVSGNASVTTGSDGRATFKSGTARTSGSFVFSVTGITLQGHAYDAAANVETSDSITP